MERCNPVEMRKNLEAVEIFKKYGIDFVAVPVRSLTHKYELVTLTNKILKELEDQAN